MNHRFITIRGMIVLLGTILPATAGDQQTHVKTVRKNEPVTTTQYHTAGYQAIRQLTGDLTLDQAVNIALRQNPAILAQVQEIQRTRGEIIEARAAALPQITLTGAYEHQDDRLLKGGGEGGGGTNALPSSAVTTPSAIPTATSNGLNTTGTQVITPIAPIGTAGAGNTGTTPTSTGSGTSAGTTAMAAPPGSGAIASREAAMATGGRAAVVTRAVTATPTGTTTSTTNANGSTTTTNSSSNNSVSVNQLLKELGTQNGSNTSNVLQNESWNITIEVRQILYAGGQIEAAIKIAKFSQDSAYYQLRDTIDTIVSTVRTQFFDVLLNRALITVQEESVRLLEQQLQDQKNRFEAGTVPRFNVLQAEVALANQRPSLISARNNYLLAQIQLAKTLGISPGPGGKPAFFCVGELGVPERNMRLADALDIAHARRPFLKVQRQSILIQVEDIKVQMAGYKPELDAHAGYELRNRSTSEDLTNTANGWFFGFTGSWAIFDGFSTYGRVKQARARLEEAKLNYDDSVQQVDLQVQTAYANMQQSRETIASQQENVKEALEAVRLSQERLNAGAGTQLDVLNAEVQLTTARTTELQARGNYNIALAQFDLATATDTVYAEKFKDPLGKVEKGVFARVAESGLPKVPPADETPPRDHGKYK
jgi:outer membrane protein TolC